MKGTGEMTTEEFEEQSTERATEFNEKAALQLAKTDEQKAALLKMKMSQYAEVFNYEQVRKFAQNVFGMIDGLRLFELVKSAPEKYGFHVSFYGGENYLQVRQHGTGIIPDGRYMLWEATKMFVRFWMEVYGNGSATRPSLGLLNHWRVLTCKLRKLEEEILQGAQDGTPVKWQLKYNRNMFADLEIGFDEPDAPTGSHPQR